MKISKSSWHYRLMNYLYEGDIKNNLCGYFWQIIFTCIHLPYTSSFYTLVRFSNNSKNKRYLEFFIISITVNILAIYAFYTAFTTDFYGNIYYNYIGSANDNEVYRYESPDGYEISLSIFIIASIYYIILAGSLLQIGGLIVSGITVLIFGITEYLAEKIGKSSIIGEYAKARKNKYCNTLEFVDDKKEDVI